MSFFIVKNAAEIHVWLLEVIQIFDTSHVLPVVLYGVDLQFVGRALLSPYWVNTYVAPTCLRMCIYVGAQQSVWKILLRK